MVQSIEAVLEIILHDGQLWQADMHVLRLGQTGPGFSDPQIDI
jgi:hypothetical protein